jgi:hypothetical protein
MSAAGGYRSLRPGESDNTHRSIWPDGIAAMTMPVRVERSGSSARSCAPFDHAKGDEYHAFARRRRVASLLRTRLISCRHAGHKLRDVSAYMPPQFGLAERPTEHHLGVADGFR